MPFTPLPTDREINPQNYQGPVNPFVDSATAMKVNESSALAQEVNADKPELGDPALVFFDTGPVIDSDYRPEDLNSIEALVGREWSATKPKNLAEYITMVERLIQRVPHMAAPIKRRMQNMPAGRIKDEYQSKMQDAAMKRQIQKDIEMDIYRKKALKAANVPDPEAAKAEAEKRKGIETQIKNIQASLKDWTGSPQRRRMEEMRVDRLYAQIDKMDGVSLEDLPPAPPKQPGAFERFTTGWGNMMTPLREPEMVTPPAQQPMAARDQEILRMAKANPNNPKAQRVLQVMQQKYGIQ